MSNFRLKKIMICIALPMVINGCAPLVPDNYLGPSTIRSPQKINGHWIQPRVIPISTNMLNTPEGQELLAPAMKPQPYRIGAYDNLDVIIWGHPELSTVATTSTPIPGAGFSPMLSQTSAAASTNTSNPPILVQTDGTLFYPYVGHVKAAGLTIDELQRVVTHRLSRYIRSPQVTIQVAKFRNRNAYVLGEVRRPGSQPLTDKPLTLMEAISDAGDINTATADPKHIYLVRGSYEQPYVFWLDAQTPQALMIAEQFPLQENDIVYVSSATLTGLNNFLNQVLPSLSTYVIARNFSQ